MVDHRCILGILVLLLNQDGLLVLEVIRWLRSIVFIPRGLVLELLLLLSTCVPLVIGLGLVRLISAVCLILLLDLAVGAIVLLSLALVDLGDHLLVGGRTVVGPSCNEVIILNLHLPEHDFNVGVIHVHFVLPSHLLLHDALVFLLVVHALVPLVLSALAVTLHLVGQVHRHIGRALDLVVAAAIGSNDVGPLRVITAVSSQVQLFSLVVEGIVLYNLSNYLSDIILVSHLLKDGCDPIQFGVGHVVVPTDARDGVLRLEHEGDRRVVNDDNISHRTTQLGQILHEGVVVVSAVLTEELVGAEAIGVQLSDKGLGVL
mmetsp:Transcript_2375/g.3605  ORF Transcript_2375/g.3605 Transcript_2375/m.3605 type:complete len:317 (-) Transcript_2375:521-1471(-)